MNRPITAASAIKAIAPDAEFAIIDGVIDWHKPDIPQPTEAEITAKIAELEEGRERAAMVASPAQIEVTLYDLGLIEAFDAISAADPRAAIKRRTVLEYRRTNPSIEALTEEGFTPEQIDDIFRYAMDLVI